MKKFVTILIIIIITFLLALGVYYWFSAREEGTVIDGDNTEISIIQKFNPFNRSSANTTTDNTIPETIIEDQIPTNDDDTVIPILRKISEEPIGGYIASTTASSTIVRYIDRGTGHIYEARDDTNIIEKLSNTTIPRVYWGRFFHNEIYEGRNECNNQSLWRNKPFFEDSKYNR